MGRRTLTWLIAIAAAAPAPAQTVDEILEKYLEARGGKARCESVESVRARGTAVMGGGVEGKFLSEWRKPDQFRIELTLQGQTEIQAHDGGTGWYVDPPEQTEPADLTPQRFAMLNDAVEFFGPLVGLREKGHAVELVGKELIEGTEAYHLKVSKKNGMVEHSYLDAEHFLEILQVEKHQTPSGELEMEITCGDYKEVGGLMIPHSWSRRIKGGPALLTLMFEEMQLDAGVPASRFQRPARAE